MKRLSRDACAALLQAIDAYVEKADKSLLEMLRKAGYANPKKTLEAIDSLSAALEKTLNSQGRHIIDSLRDVVYLPGWIGLEPNGDELDYLVNQVHKDETRNQLLQAYKDSFCRAFRKYMPEFIQSYHGAIDNKLTTGRITKRTTDWMTNSWPKEVAKFIEQGVINDLQRILKTSIKKGEPVDKLMRRIMESDIRNPEWKARRIALTEILRAHSYSQLEAYRTNPAVSGKRWMHTGAKFSVARENHVALNGTAVPVNALFTIPVSGEQCMCPRDARLSPGESVNCHCLIQPVVDEEVLGLSLEERQRLYDKAVADDDFAWEKELDRKNHRKADARRREIDANARFENPEINSKAQNMLRDRYETGSETAKIVYDRYIQEGTAVIQWDPKDKNGNPTAAYYSSRDNGVHMHRVKMFQGSGRGDGFTLYHEEGHVVDCRSASSGDIRIGSDDPVRYTSMDPKYKFADALRRDVRALEKRKRDEYKDIRSGVDIKEWARLKNAQEIRALDGSAGLQDIVGGVDQKYIEFLDYCHGEDSANPGHSYWEREGALETEAFANMFDAAFDPGKTALMEKYLPRSWKTFLQMLEDIK